MNYNAPKAINSLFVYEGDIYVTGTRTDVVSGSTTITEYSQAPPLSDSDVTQSAAVRSVFVAANGVVYAAGNNGYWVNDVVWK
ncbi:MAG: hypothetical protein LBJ58_04265, partial [Tannerellaceae bacterium]|nr:hypothetical protein [Tannerellaceae bacterium]